MTVNKENIAKVIKAIEGEAGATVGFNMCSWVDSDDSADLGKWSCGTTACIAGHAYLLATGSTTAKAEKLAEDDSNAIEKTAAEWLGIDQFKAMKLFWDIGHDLNLDLITPEHAIATLTHLADTGEVDWRRNRHL